MTGLVAGFGAKIAGSLILGKVKNGAAAGLNFLSAIPQQAWEAFAVVGYVLAIFFLHQHYAHAALKAADQEGYNRRAFEDAKVLVELQGKERTAETNGKAIAQTTRNTNDAQNTAIAADARSVLARGPGAARCRQLDHPAVSAASGQSGAASVQLPDATGNPVPAGDGQSNVIAVPFDWLVGRAAQADSDRAEVVAWRSWYVSESAEWAKLKTAGK